MAPVGCALSSSTSVFVLSSMQKVPRNWHFNQRSKELCVIASYSGSKLVAESAVSAVTTESTNFGFKSLAETFWIDVQRAEGRPLNVKVNAPLRMGSLSLGKVENVAVRVELSNGCVGWGEVAVVRSVAAPNQATALKKANQACEFLNSSSPMILNSALEEISGILPGHEFASVRAGVEMALIDAVANSIDVPIWRLFGGVSNTLSTAITLQTASPSEASELASTYSQLGFNVFKFQMGQNLSMDTEVLQAIQSAHPHCSLILDVYGGHSPKETMEVLHHLKDSGITPVLIEQPVNEDDWEGLGELMKLARGKYGLSVAVDEAFQGSTHLQRVIKENFVDVINIKLSKFGVMGSLEIIKFARRSGIKLMVSSVAETRLATGFAGHLAAGLGCFKFVCLDSPFLMAEDPVFCGYEVSGAVYKLLNPRGQGGFLKWEVTPR